MLVLFAFQRKVFPQTTKHVVIITIDGFRPDFYMDKEWGMVNLLEMKENGIYAKGVNSTFPTLTFPNHTTIITGQRSKNHGVYYNAPFDGSEWYWYAQDIKVPTLWDLAKKEGLITASVNWPVSVGAPIDYNIPIIKEKGRPQLEVIKEFSNPKGFLDEIERNATGILSHEDMVVSGNLIAMDENVGRASAYILRRYKPSLMTIRFSSIDHFQHKEGRNGPTVKKAVAGVDRALRNIIESLERGGVLKESTIIVTGDHGFVDVHTTIYPNVWLREAGLIMDKKFWKAKFYTTGGSAFLMLRDKNDESTKFKIREILEELPHSHRKLFKVVEKEVLTEMGTDPSPVLALAGQKGIRFGGRITGNDIGPAKGGSHGYFPDFNEIQTGFVACGAGINKGNVISEMGLEDIAPIVSALLGLPLKTNEGVLMEGVLSD
nr:ectonucleotide pyrophosphatase/phosphodiesterase [Echinicola shivajiensis]